MNEFKEVWETKRKCVSDRKAETASRGREKVRRMLYCIAESYRSAERRFFKSGVVMAIYQDARQGVLALEYSAVSKETLEHRHGLLGLAENFGPLTKLPACEWLGWTPAERGRRHEFWK